MRQPEVMILAVDDKADECGNMSDILADQGCRVDTAHEGSTVPRLAKRQAYDLALLVMRIPGIDRLTLCREVM